MTFFRSYGVFFGYMDSPKWMIRSWYKYGIIIMHISIEI
ncbi:hypothetical protein CGLO_17286 [Colletotrichum gloeosporioides Cg-14]|uniref:Uncharacterized protein n=1 Tax=Colletotrichum gloeosporioides (strain Cg-14) TaxID=1237896 RepID=T0JU20_COLGC|nr:hypothetical protein CGLO_17286 [Colletotrichum gloeosporioides Cg-14]